MTAPEPAALARQRRVTLAEALEKFPEMSTHDPEKLGRMSMHVYDAEPPKPAKPALGLVLIFAGLIAVLFTLMIAHLVVRSGVAGWL